MKWPRIHFFELFFKRSTKLSILVLSYSVNSIKQQKFKAFAQAVFSIIKEKCSIMIHAICIEPFTEFFKAYVSIFGKFLNAVQVQEVLQVSLMTSGILHIYMTLDFADIFKIYICWNCTNKTPFIAMCYKSK